MYLLPKLWTQFASFSTDYTHRSGFEVTETNVEYKISIPLIGMGLEQILIELEDDLLTIKTEPNESELMTDAQLLWSEFEMLNFERDFRVPRNVNKENIKAKLENGLLEIHLPKVKANKQKISIDNLKVG